MSETVMNILKFLMGFGMAFLIPLTGLVITNYTENTAPLTASVIMVPIVAFIMFRRVRPAGWGLIAGIIPLAVLIFIFAMASQLH